MTFDKDARRARLRVYIGSGSVVITDHMMNELVTEITRMFGGLTVGREMGFWAPDGNNPDGPYNTREMVHEETLRIELLIYEQQVEGAIAMLKDQLRTMKLKHSLAINAVHVEVSAAEAHHFVLD